MPAAKPRCSQCVVRCPGYDQSGGRAVAILDLGEVVVYLVATTFRWAVPNMPVVARGSGVSVTRVCKTA